MGVTEEHGLRRLPGRGGGLPREGSLPTLPQEPGHRNAGWPWGPWPPRPPGPLGWGLGAAV